METMVVTVCLLVLIVCGITMMWRTLNYRIACLNNLVNVNNDIYQNKINTAMEKNIIRNQKQQALFDYLEIKIEPTPEPKNPYIVVSTKTGKTKV